VLDLHKDFDGVSIDTTTTTTTSTSTPITKITTTTTVSSQTVSPCPSIDPVEPIAPIEPRSIPIETNIPIAQVVDPYAEQKSTLRAMGFEQSDERLNDLLSSNKGNVQEVVYSLFSQR